MSGKAHVTTGPLLKGAAQNKDSCNELFAIVVLLSLQIMLDHVSSLNKK